MDAMWLGLIAAVLFLMLAFTVGVVIAAVPRLREISDELQATLSSVQRALFQLEALAGQMRQSGTVDKLNSALSTAQGAAGRIDPLAGELGKALESTREMLDDVKETSQSVRVRVEDLAAAQSELTALASALTDVVSSVRDRELAEKLANVLSDTSLLAADLGVLAENATTMLESGKPLVSNLGNVVGDARRRASGISSALGSLREGFRAGVESWRDKPQ